MIILQKHHRRQQPQSKQHATKRPFLLYGFLPLIVLLLHFNVYGQIDQTKVDSLANYIDSSTKAHRYWQDSFNKVQDSIYHSAINSDSSNNQLTDPTGEITRTNSTTILLVICVMLLVAGIIVLAGRRKTKP